MGLGSGVTIAKVSGGGIDFLGA